MPSIYTKIERYKTLLAFGSLLVTTLVGVATATLNYFATQEQMRYSMCVSDRDIKAVRATMEKAILETGLAELTAKSVKLQDRVHNFWNYFSDADFLELRRTDDLITRSNDYIKKQEAIIDFQANRDCVEEAKEAAP